MSASRILGRKAGAKIGKNLNKKGKGWKNTKRGGVWDEKTRMNTTNIKNPYFCMFNVPSKLRFFLLKCLYTAPWQELLGLGSRN